MDKNYIDELSNSGFDVEAELASILDEEIWKEIELSTSRTKKQLNDDMMIKIRTIAEQG